MMTRSKKNLQKVALNDPVFNYREIAKQMLLLEDHLTTKGKFCKDCIFKHFLTVEALAEEALLLDKKSEYRSESSLADLTRQWIVDFSDGKDPLKLSQMIRVKRKELTNKYYDPRI